MNFQFWENARYKLAIVRKKSELWDKKLQLPFLIFYSETGFHIYTDLSFSNFSISTSEDFYQFLVLANNNKQSDGLFSVKKIFLYNYYISITENNLNLGLFDFLHFFVCVLFGKHKSTSESTFC